MSAHRWRVFHADGPPPPPDVLSLRGSSGVWDRVGDDLWRCPGGTTFLAWADMPWEWGRYVECPSWQAVVDVDVAARVRR